MTHPFDIFTDANAMGEIFQARQWPLAAGGPRVLGCEILFAHHKAYLRPESLHKSYLSLCYALRLAGGADDNRGCGGRLMFYAKAYYAERSAGEIAAAGADWYWPDLKLALWVFPHDPKLPHLAPMTDPSAIAEHLPYGNLPVGFDRADAIARIAAEAIHYYPEARCLCRYDLTSSAAGGQRQLSLFGKIFHDHQGAEAYRRQVELWQISQRGLRKFSVARPLGYSPSVKTLWLAQAAGVPAKALLDGAAGAAWLGALVEGLADLHRLAPSGAARHRVAGQVQELRFKAQLLAHQFGALAPALKALRKDLERAAAGLTPTRESFIHGDFHLRQLLADDAEIVFLDFDECGIGDPLQDVASFLVDLYFYDFSAPQAARMGRQFLRAYQRAAAGGILLDRLDWQIRLQFFTKAYRVYRQHQRGAESIIAGLLELAARGIAADLGVGQVSRWPGERGAGL